jgi:hypothetical protein
LKIRIVFDQVEEQIMAQENSLIFLPDISGFTKFVSSTESEHSQHIIAELLELLIDNEELELTLSDIEGDAIFYYKYRSVPTQEELFKQVKKMFVNFHSHLKLYEERRICQCGACCSASELNLKFFAHAGLVDFIKIKEDKKPYGQDVIVAHRLMKNDVPIDDYLLVSQGVFDAWGIDEVNIPTELKGIKSHTEYDLGRVDYQYFELSPYRKYAKLPDPVKTIIASDPVVKISETIGQRPQELFEFVSNFDYRLKYNKGVDSIDYQKNRVNRVGTNHICVINNKKIEFETVTKDLGEDKLVYGELTHDFPIVKDMATFFVIEPDRDKSKITIEAHPQNPSLFSKIVLFFLKIFISKSIKELLANIKTAVEKEELITQEPDLLKPHSAV